jgi:CheY-like chemotaxis protein
MGYQTIQVESTRSAIRVLESDATVDVMLTDIVMPGGMDGRSLARAAVKLRADLPIILTSGFPNETNTAGADGDNGGQGRDYGDGAGDAWSTAGMPVLAKPVRRDALARRLQQVLTAAALPPTGCPQPHGQL